MWAEHTVPRSDCMKENGITAPASCIREARVPKRINFLRTLVCLVLAALTLCLYWPACRHDFIHLDDPDYVTENPHVKAGLTWAGLGWAFRTSFSSNWHPLTWLSHMMDCQFYGLNPAGHHLTNVVFHVSNALLLLLLFERMTGALWPSAFVAGLFALHPCHVESVAWISERKDVLSTFFFMLTLWAYVRYVEQSRGQKSDVRNQKSSSSIFRRPSSIFYTCALIFFALGLMSKPMLVSLPCVMLLLDWWPLKRIQVNTQASQFKAFAALLFEKAPFFGLAILSSIMTFLAQRSEGSVLSLGLLPMAPRVANTLLAYEKYLSKAFWPVDLAVFYPYPREWSGWALAGAALLLASLTTAALVGLQRKPYLAVGWFWFLGTLVPVIGLVQVGQQAMADRYSYIPLVGVFVLAAWCLGEAANRWLWLKLPIIISSVAVLALCLPATRQQLRFWKNERVLFEHALAVTSGNHIAYTVLGALSLREGDSATAIGYLSRALTIAPAYPEAHHNLGCAMQAQAKHTEAISSFREALRLNPRYAKAYEALGVSLFRLGNFREAEAAFRQALELKPGNLEAQLNLAMALHNLGRLDAAKESYEKVLLAEPESITAHQGLGNILSIQGHFDQAAVHYAKALEPRPGDSNLRTVYGVALAAQGKLDEAVAQLYSALAAKPDNAHAHYELAQVLVRQGKTQEAVFHYRHTLLLEPNQAEALNNLAWILATDPSPPVRNGAEAVGLAKRACESTGYRQAQLIGTLAAAYAEAGRFTEAQLMAEKAGQLARQMGLMELAAKNEELLKLYRANRPYHAAE